jgi:hypothetical protein
MLEHPENQMLTKKESLAITTSFRSLIKCKRCSLTSDFAIVVDPEITHRV